MATGLTPRRVIVLAENGVSATTRGVAGGGRRGHEPEGHERRGSGVLHEMCKVTLTVLLLDRPRLLSSPPRPAPADAAALRAPAARALQSAHVTLAAVAPRDPQREHAARCPSRPRASVPGRRVTLDGALRFGTGQRKARLRLAAAARERVRRSRCGPGGWRCSRSSRARPRDARGQQHRAHRRARRAHAAGAARLKRALKLRKAPSTAALGTFAVTVAAAGGRARARAGRPPRRSSSRPRRCPRRRPTPVATCPDFAATPAGSVDWFGCDLAGLRRPAQLDRLRAAPLPARRRLQAATPGSVTESGGATRIRADFPYDHRFPIASVTRNARRLDDDPHQRQGRLRDARPRHRRGDRRLPDRAAADGMHGAVYADGRAKDTDMSAAACTTPATPYTRRARLRPRPDGDLAGRRPAASALDPRAGDARAGAEGRRRQLTGRPPVGRARRSRCRRDEAGTTTSAAAAGLVAAAALVAVPAPRPPRCTGELTLTRREAVPRRPPAAGDARRPRGRRCRSPPRRFAGGAVVDAGGSITAARRGRRTRHAERPAAEPRRALAVQRPRRQDAPDGLHARPERDAAGPDLRAAAGDEGRRSTTELQRTLRAEVPRARHAGGRREGRPTARAGGHGLPAEHRGRRAAGPRHRRAADQVAARERAPDNERDGHLARARLVHPLHRDRRGHDAVGRRDRRPARAPTRLVYSLHFPSAGGWCDPATGAARLTFTGTVGFSYRDHGIDLRASTPELELDGAASRLIFDMSGRRQVIETLDVSKAAVSASGQHAHLRPDPRRDPAGRRELRVRRLLPPGRSVRVGLHHLHDHLNRERTPGP